MTGTWIKPEPPPGSLAVIVDGGADFEDFDAICRALDLVRAKHSKLHVVRHLGAVGCQRLAGRWALQEPGMFSKPARDWSEAVAAGAVRCVAFPGAGLELLGLCAVARIPVWHPFGGSPEGAKR